MTILIGSGTRGASALEIASLLTSREMDLDQLARVTRIEELTHVKGLGPARASVIVAALELGRRLAEKQVAKGPGSDVPAMQPALLWSVFATK